MFSAAQFVWTSATKQTTHQPQSRPRATAKQATTCGTLVSIGLARVQPGEPNPWFIGRHQGRRRDLHRFLVRLTYLHLRQKRPRNRRNGRAAINRRTGPLRRALPWPRCRVPHAASPHSPAEHSQSSHVLHESPSTGTSRQPFGPHSRRMRGAAAGLTVFGLTGATGKTTGAVQRSETAKPGPSRSVTANVSTGRDAKDAIATMPKRASKNPRMSSPHAKRK